MIAGQKYIMGSEQVEAISATMVRTASGGMIVVKNALQEAPSVAPSVAPSAHVSVSETHVSVSGVSKKEVAKNALPQKVDLAKLLRYK